MLRRQFRTEVGRTRLGLRSKPIAHFRLGRGLPLGPFGLQILGEVPDLHSLLEAARVVQQILVLLAGSGQAHAIQIVVHPVEELRDLFEAALGRVGCQSWRESGGVLPMAPL